MNKDTAALCKAIKAYAEIHERAGAQSMKSYVMSEATAKKLSAAIGKLALALASATGADAAEVREAVQTMAVVVAEE